MSENVAYEAIEKPVLHLIPGVSASGKTTMARHMVERLSAENIASKFVVPHTTRPARDYEKHGVDYFFHTQEEFNTKYRDLCNDEETGWAASSIGGHYYFNSKYATEPTDAVRVSVLPVAFSAIGDVLTDHESDQFGISILPVIIAETIRDRWLSSVRPMRPGRDLEAELDQQAEFLDTYVGPIFNPAWRLETDKDQYYQQSRLIMAGGHIIMQNTVEEY